MCIYGDTGPRQKTARKTSEDKKRSGDSDQRQVIVTEKQDINRVHQLSYLVEMVDIVVGHKYVLSGSPQAPTSEGQGHNSF